MHSSDKTLNPSSLTSSRDIPGPPGHPILGNLPDIQRDRLAFMLDAVRRYGPVMKMRIGFTDIIQVSHPEGVQHILQRNNHNYTKKSMAFSPLRDLLGNGLLLSDGDFWLGQRRLMQPAFHRQRIQEMSNMMVQEIEFMLEAWGSYAASGEPVNLLDEMMHLTLTIITRALFSERIDDQTGTIGESITTLLEDSIYRFDHPFYPPRGIPTPRNRHYRKAKKALYEVIDGIITRRRAHPNDYMDLLQMLMDAKDENTGDSMSDEQLRHEAVTLFIAGHETTAVALTWAFYLLAENPQSRKLLGDEISRVLDGRTPLASDLADLEYTRMVLDETLRLYPPAWVTNRKASQEDQIGGYYIPAGAEVSVSPYVTHRDPTLWPEPEQFEPSRFKAEIAAERPRYAYFPFGGGPRQCIGNNFALMEAQLALAAIAQRYTLELAPDKPVETEPLITLRPKDGLWFTLQPV